MSTEPASLTAPVKGATRASTHSSATTAKAPRGLGRSVWWRHALAVVALIWALFPILFLISAAFNPSGTLNSAELIPKSFSLTNFDTLFNDPARPFTTWFKNSMLVAFIGASGQVFIGACAAYAFSRMRFKGRRGGLLSLLLLQMFPALLTFVALYLMFAKISDIVPAFGLNTVLGLGLVYLGGAMGANVWLLKGYFDTVPRELDEAAKVDGLPLRNAIPFHLDTNPFLNAPADSLLFQPGQQPATEGFTAEPGAYCHADRAFAAGNVTISGVRPQCHFTLS